MSAPRMKSGRMARAAILLMIGLGVFSILVSVALAIILICLGVAMFLLEVWLVRKVARVPKDDH
jgi:hypothetical protein